MNELNPPAADAQARKTWVARQRGERAVLPRRTGVIARKEGMSRVFDTDGSHVPVTVLSLQSCRVLGHRTIEKDGYAALRLCAGAVKVKNLTKPERGQFSSQGVAPAAAIREFRVHPSMLVPVNAELRADHFVPGQRIDVSGNTIGKGFAGAMKRWNFGGLRATHGVSVSHRSHGSTGQRQDPGRVFRNKKMAGHLGDERRTEQSLEVVRVDPERGLIYVRGSVPGANGGWLELVDATRVSKQALELPRPAAFNPPAALAPISSSSFVKAKGRRDSRHGEIGARADDTHAPMSEQVPSKAEEIMQGYSDSWDDLSAREPEKRARAQVDVAKASIALLRSGLIKRPDGLSEDMLGFASSTPQTLFDALFDDAPLVVESAAAALAAIEGALSDDELDRPLRPASQLKVINFLKRLLTESDVTLATTLTLDPPRQPGRFSFIVRVLDELALEFDKSVPLARPDWASPIDDLRVTASAPDGHMFEIETARLDLPFCAVALHASVEVPNHEGVVEIEVVMNGHPVMRRSFSTATLEVAQNSNLLVRYVGHI